MSSAASTPGDERDVVILLSKRGKSLTGFKRLLRIYHLQRWDPSTTKA